MSKRIEKILRKALLQDGEMRDELYHWELSEHIDYWRNGLIENKNEYVYVVTEHSGDVAILLITDKNELFINEKARKRIRLFCDSEDIYQHNMEFMIPIMAEQLSEGVLSVNGVKYVNKDV